MQTVPDGERAWELLQRERIPVVISDWDLPRLDGLELCRRIRARAHGGYIYFILLTSQGGKKRFMIGMEAGADDFITKPLDPDELKARIAVADRILGLRRELQQLEGLLPICAYCRRIRDEGGEWESIESYVERHTAAPFSHGVCQACYETVVKPQIDRLGNTDDPGAGIARQG